MTMNKVVLDTNVLVYSLDAQSNFHASAVDVIVTANVNDFSGIAGIRLLPLTNAIR